MAKTFYDIFEVDTSATPDQIRIAYKRMVQRHHPDKHRGQASSEELLKAINYAYSILSDARKRASYDSKLAGGAHGAAANGVGDAYVYTGEASVNGSTGAQAAASAAARDAVSAAVAARPFATRDPDWSRISHINSWLALGMLILLFLAASRFFSQATTYGVLSTTDPGSTTLFYGIMVGTVIAAAAVWLVGKVVAYALPLAWPMNLIFRAKVRSDLNPEQRRIASAVLVIGILLTFAVPDLDRQNELAATSMATAPVAVQSPRKNTTVLSGPEPAAPVILPLARPSDAVEPRNISAPAPPPPITTKPKVIVAESPPPAPIKAAAPLPSPRVMAETKIHNPPVPAPPALTRAVPAPAAQARNMVPAPVTTVKPQPVPAPIVATARVKPVEPAKPAAQKTPLAAALPAKAVATAPAVIPPPQSEKKMTLPTPPPPEPKPRATALEKSAATPPALTLVTPESTMPGSAPPPAKNVTEKKEAPALQNNTALVEEGDPTLASHRKRAQQGAADAQYQLGRAYEKGDGVARDYGQAEAWYRKAADHGYGPAQYSLGSMYMLGKGVAMDPVSAYVWLGLAVNNKISSAQQPMDYLADTLTPEQLADAKRKVAKWSPQRKR